MLKAKKYYSQYADKEGWIDSEIEPHYFDAKIEIQYMAPIPPYYFRKVLHVDEADFSMGSICKWRFIT